MRKIDEKERKKDLEKFLNSWERVGYPGFYPTPRFAYIREVIRLKMEIRTNRLTNHQNRTPLTGSSFGGLFQWFLKPSSITDNLSKRRTGLNSGICYRLSKKSKTERVRLVLTHLLDVTTKCWHGFSMLAVEFALLNWRVIVFISSRYCMINKSSAGIAGLKL